MDGIRRVVVTGGSGYIGSFLVKRLREEGFEVLNLDQARPSERDVPWVYIDLRDRQAVQAQLEGFDAVCHLGEIPNVSARRPGNDVFAHNCAVASTVLQSAVDIGIRKIVYTSTCQVYGIWGAHGRTPPLPLRWPMDEDQPVCPLNAYAAGKVAAEHYAAMLCASEPGVSIVSLRFPWVLTREIDDWIHERVERSSAGRFSEMGTYLHIDDAVEGYLAALRSDRVGYRVYHLVADDVMTLLPVREAMARGHPHFPPMPEDWPEHRSPVSTERARRELGWTPRFRILDLHAEWNKTRSRRVARTA